MGLAQNLNSLLRYDPFALASETEVGFHLLKVGLVAYCDRFGPCRSTPGSSDLLMDQVIPNCCEVLVCLHIQEPDKRWKIYYPLSPRRTKNFIEAADLPLARVRYCARSNHVQVDVSHASGQMVISLHGRRVISVLPECPATVLARIKFLGYSSLYQLQRTRYFVPSLVRAEQVNVIACSYVVQDGQAVAPLSFEQPVSPAPPVALEFQQKLSLMAAMRDVPDVTSAKDAVSSGHWEDSAILGHKSAI